MESQYLAWGLILIGVAVFLVVVEVFVPSGGIIAVVAALSAIAGVIALFVHDPIWGLIGLVGVAIATPIAIIGGFKIWSSTKIGRRMLGEESEILLTRQRDEERQRREQVASMVGMEGVCLTDLHPIGVVRIDDKRYDAQAEVQFIDAGERIVVQHADGFQMKVRRVGS